MIFTLVVTVVVLVVVGLGVAAWLYSMTNTGRNDQRGRELGLW